MRDDDSSTEVAQEDQKTDGAEGKGMEEEEEAAAAAGEEEELDLDDVFGGPAKNSDEKRSSPSQVATGKIQSSTITPSPKNPPSSAPTIDASHVEPDKRSRGASLIKKMAERLPESLRNSLPPPTGSLWIPRTPI